ncbi:cupredoxin domain-containing protein [Saccharothrix stipae]
MTTRTAERSTGAATTALLATAVLAAANASYFLVLAGQPNPGMAAVSALPLATAALLWRRVRFAPVVTIVVAVATVFFHPVDLAFDLGRPGDVPPFAVAAVLVAAAGVAVVSSVVLMSGRGRGVGGERLVVLGGGAAVGVALAATLLVVWPQADDTGSLTDEQIAALPTVDMENFKFSPAQLRVDRGRPVAFRFTNDTDDNHTFTITELGVDVEVPSGRTRITVVAAEPGRYAVHCAAGDHREKGMVGRLTVTDGALPAPSSPTAGETSGAHHHG